MIRFTIKQLEEKQKERPQGYSEEILSRAQKIDSEIYEIDDFVFSELAEKYRMPSKMEMIKNVALAAKDAATKGIKARPAEEVEKNLKICTSCPYLIENGFRCGKCGCQISYKVLLKAWKCPLNRW